MSASVPPLDVITLPRYVNSFTLSIFVPLIVNGMLLSLLIVRDFVLLMLICNPHLWVSLIRASSCCTISWCDCVIKQTSSAYSKSVRYDVSVQRSPRVFFVASVRAQSSTILKRSGDSGHPCLTPHLMFMVSLVRPLCSTLHFASLYISLISFIGFSGIPCDASAFHMILCGMLSKALLKSINTRNKGVLYSTDCSMMILRVFM